MQLGVSRGFPAFSNLSLTPAGLLKVLGPSLPGDSLSLLPIFMVGNGTLRVQLLERDWPISQAQL